MFTTEFDHDEIAITILDQNNETMKGNETMKNNETIKYKAGYLLTIASWENDGDNSLSKQVHFTDKAKLKATIEFCKLFMGNFRTTGPSVGNLYDANDFEEEVIRDIFYEFYLKNKDFFDEESEDPEVIRDWCMDEGYGLGLSGTDFYTRKCESIKVEYFKEDVYCEDMTSQFLV